MVRWRDEQQNHPARRARRTAATRLGAEAAGLETAGHCRSPRGDARCCEPMCEPMAQAGTRARHMRTGCAAIRGLVGDRGSPPNNGRSSRSRGARARSVRLPRADLDVQARGGGDSARVWRQLPPGACQPVTASAHHSVQQPKERASQRNAAAIQVWWRERWPALEKKRSRKDGPSSG